MIKKKIERVKTAILLILIITSVLQVGILWNYQSHGFPISFFGVKQVDAPSSVYEIDELASRTFFKPFRIVLYSGQTQEQIIWPLSKSNSNYQKLWTEAQDYMHKAMNSSRLEKLDRDMWSELIKNEAIVFELASPFPAEMIRYFLGIADEEGNDVKTVHKVMLSMKESETDMTVYLLGDSLYKLGSVSASADGMARGDYERVFSSQMNSYGTLEYRLLGTSGLVENAAPDVMSNLTADSKLFDGYRLVTPVNKLKDIELMKNLLLDRHRESFDTTQTAGMIEFQTLDNTYSIDLANSVVEFDFNPGQFNQGLGNAGDAFRIVFRKINAMKEELIPDTDMYLSSVEETAEGEIPAYVFKFGFMAGDYPVYLRKSGVLQFPLEISANSSDIIKFRWTVRGIAKTNKQTAFDVNFLHSVQKLIDKYGLKDSKFRIDNAIEGYTPHEDGVETLLPSLVLETDLDMLYVPMNAKEE